MGQKTDNNNVPRSGGLASIRKEAGLFAACPSRARTHGQLAQLASRQNLADHLPVAQFIVDENGFLRPRDRELMRLHSVQMFSHGTQELRDLHGSSCLSREAPAPFLSTLGIQPGDVSLIVM